MSVGRSHAERAPLTIGWEAARANARPAFILQGLMLAVLIGYYASPRVAHALEVLAEERQRYGIFFIVGAAILAGAIVPEIFVIFFFQKGKVRRENLRNLAFTIPTWAVDGILVDWMYRLNAHWFGDVVTAPVLIAKICVDQFGYNPFFAAPCEVLIYEWKNEGFSWASARRALSWAHYRDKIVPTLLATWAVWMPLMAIIYALPLALQFPLFSIALTFWVLLLTYMTNRFAGKVEADEPLVLATAHPQKI
ncbi:MAG: hypothetical protein M3Y86_12235 [Verrucomicrobiota bacterium]|nr:hypothetical protein [Verrucomicrobiota bacterium]